MCNQENDTSRESELSDIQELHTSVGLKSINSGYAELTDDAVIIVPPVDVQSLNNEKFTITIHSKADDIDHETYETKSQGKWHNICTNSMTDMSHYTWLLYALTEYRHLKSRRAKAAIRRKARLFSQKVKFEKNLIRVNWRDYND